MVYYIDIHEKDQSIRLKYKQCPSLDDIKQTIFKRMQLDKESYNLMIAEDVIMSDEHLATIFEKNTNRLQLNIIKHAALVQQEMPLVEEHEINSHLNLPRNGLFFHSDKDDITQNPFEEDFQQKGKAPDAVQKGDDASEIEQPNQPVPARNQDGMMNFLVHLWQWITNFLKQFLGRFEEHHTQTAPMSLN